MDKLKSFYDEKRDESKRKNLKIKADNIRKSLEQAEERLKNFDDHLDCNLYKSILYMTGSRLARIKEKIKAEYENLNGEQLKLLHKEEEVLEEIFNMKEQLEKEIEEGHKQLRSILERI